MRKRADTLFWISIIASAFVFPAAAFSMFTVWFIRLDLPPSTDAIQTRAILVTTRPVPSVQGQVEAAVTPLKAIAEPAASPPAARIPELLSTKPGQGNA